MAKADISLPGGGKVTVEGSPEEIKALLDFYAAKGRGSTKATDLNREAQLSPTSPKPTGPKAHIRDLKEEGFFRTKQTLKAVQEKLAEKGFIYPPSTLSAALIKLTKSKELGRMKEQGHWVYVQR